jgi:NlpC/P60 family putative phage cell wall peptidase
MIRRQDIVAQARRWVGTPYHHQQSHLGVGADCLGLVRGVWRDLYGAETEAPQPYSRDWAEAEGTETLIEAASRHMTAVPVAEARGGDLVVFRYRRSSPAKHVGILCAPERVVHAMEGGPAVEMSVTPWWRRRIVAAFSFPGIVD